MHPPIDPELREAIDRIPGFSTSILPRHLEKLRAADPGGPAFAGGRELKIRGRGAVELPAIELRPAPRAVATVLYLHGGGMMFGSERTGLGLIASWVEEVGVAIVSLGYRLAPEHPHPVPVEDCYAGLEWVAANAVGPVILVGASAGGGLAAGVAVMARDRSGPPITAMLLLSPMLDDRLETPSSGELDGEGGWDRRSNLTGWEALLGEARGTDGVSPYAAPARAADLSRLPPAYLEVGAVETLRDEVIDFGARLARAGVSTELHVWAGAVHGFDLFAPDSRVALAAKAARLAYLRRRLEKLAGC